MNKIFNILKSAIIQGFIIILFLSLFYYRIIRERYTGPINTEFNIIKIGIFVFFIIFYIYLIYRNFFPSQKINKFQLLLILFDETYQKALQETYDTIITILGASYIRKMDIFLKYWINIPLYIHKILIYIRLVIPLFLVSYFLFEITIKKGIYNFPKFIFLLLFIFFLDLLWNSCILYTQGYIKTFESYLIITIDENTKKTKYSLRPYDPNIFDDHEFFTLIEDQFIHFFYEYVMFKDEYLPFLLKYKEYFNIKGKFYIQNLRLLLWIICWSFLLSTIIIKNII